MVADDATSSDSGSDEYQDSFVSPAKRSALGYPGIRSNDHSSIPPAEKRDPVPESKGRVG